MRAGLVAVAVLLAACGADSTPAAAIPSRTPTSSASPASTVAAPTPAGPTPRSVSINCRLPISWVPADAEPTPSNSGTAFVNPRTGLLSVVAARPAPLFLTNGPSYDPAVDRWFPVPPAAIAPDGLHYAYAEWDPPAAGDRGGVHAANAPMIGNSGRVHLVDARTGADRVVYSGQPTYSVISLTQDTLYLGRFFASLAATGSQGLYVMNPYVGSPAAPVPVRGADFALGFGGWQFVADGEAWGTRFTTGIGTEMGRGNELVRLELATGAVTLWLTVPADQFILVLGVRGGLPLVLTEKISWTPGEPLGARVVLLTAARQATSLLSIDDPAFPVPNGGGIEDASALWIGGLGSVWTYDGKALDETAVISPVSLVTPGGGCQPPV